MGRIDEPSVTAFLSAILAGDRQRASDVALASFTRDGAAHFYEDVVRPALESVGALWSQNRISIADEHLATATAQTALASLYARFPWPSHGPSIVVACVEGERHELGARMVADLLALDGWRDVFLGADTPLEALAAKVGMLRPACVALSATLPANLPALERTIARVHAAAPGVHVVVGGRAIGETIPAGADRVVRTAMEGVDAVRAWKS